MTEDWGKSTYSAYNGNCVEVAYRKSSHSGGGNSNCVEVAWRKSSRSTANGQCVEVADGCGRVHVRDSKNPGGPQLSFSPADWQAFIGALKAKSRQGMN